MIPTTQESHRASLTPPTTPLHVLRPSRSTPTLRISLDDARPHPKPPLSAYPSPPSFRPSGPRNHDELTVSPTEYFVQEHMSHFPHLHSARDTLHEVYPHEGPRTSTPTRSTFRTTSYNHMALEVTPPPESFAHPRPKTPDTISSRASQISLPGSTDSFSYIFWKAPQPGVDAPEDTPRGPSPQHFLDPMEIPGQNGPRPYARTRVVSSPAVPSRTHSQIPSPSHTVYGSHKNTSNPDISLFDPALRSPKRTLFNTYPAFPLTPPRSEADPVSFYASPTTRASPISFAGIRRWLPLLDDHDSDPLNNVDVERDADEKHRVQRQRIFERNSNYSKSSMPPSYCSFTNKVSIASQVNTLAFHLLQARLRLLTILVVIPKMIPSLRIARRHILRSIRLRQPRSLFLLRLSPPCHSCQVLPVLIPDTTAAKIIIVVYLWTTMVKCKTQTARSHLLLSHTAPFGRERGMGTLVG